MHLTVAFIEWLLEQAGSNDDCSGYNSKMQHQMITCVNVILKVGQTFNMVGIVFFLTEVLD